MSSLFTKIIRGEIPAQIIAEDEDFLAILDIMPLRKGHVLVIPKVEVDYIFDLEPETLAGLMRFAQQVAIKLKKAIPCKRIGIAVIGLEVPHTHVHLVPMNNMSDLDFTQPKMKPTTEELSEVAKLLIAS